MAREFFAPVVSLGWQETNVEFDKKPRFLGLVSTDFFPRPGFYSDSAEFCRKKKQLGDERIFSARQRFSKPNSQTDTQCACSQLGLSSQHTIGTFWEFLSKNYFNRISILGTTKENKGRFDVSILKLDMLDLPFSDFLLVGA